ncbi:hypothetical protein GeomeDRAFT_1714 [Geobacter metallireducens RCH3]|uniref:Uncharacterized protein n=1 Tax=Geobacter metallireducens (strain ATCC 53774 / DSM 7210 / GS-15) TaxID=269799 RepID=Q39TT5_GEOMG|nr:Tm-1-like ATP-binding domain-containing protein [Geobacter metallireducens]ABB32339.1 protein of unknown function UPF0261 [Geobacter metallireducens GS-15]EHP86770.1 hypothetical protein GeomeDRAFT_1714 [Geobacter metallireducens RCH3]
MLTRTDGKGSKVLLIAAMDTKGTEARYIESWLAKAGFTTLIMDMGIRGKRPGPVAVTRDEVLRAAGKTWDDIQNVTSEGDAVDIMISGGVKCALALYKADLIQGVISLGGTMGTTLGTGVMRAFPIGFPKVMISTIAAKDTEAFIGNMDIFMLNSVSDLAGLNRITRKVLRNGALAIAGLVREREFHDEFSRPLAVLTTLGTTEATAARMRIHFEAWGYESVTFHTTGTGGQAMERMVNFEPVSAVVDLSLHELIDHHFGGAFDPGPERGRAALQKGIPTVIVPGNIDFLVTGPMAQAQIYFPGRRGHKHNANITCVRTSLEEIQRIAEIMAGYCNESTGPVAVLVPMKGFSCLDHEDGPQPDPEGPRVFAETFARALTRTIHFETVPLHINDEAFSEVIVGALQKIGGLRKIEADRLPSRQPATWSPYSSVHTLDRFSGNQHTTTETTGDALAA